MLVSKYILEITIAIHLNYLVFHESSNLCQLQNAKLEFGSLPMYGENGKQYYSHFEKENSEIINSNTAVFYYFWVM